MHGRANRRQQPHDVSRRRSLAGAHQQQQRAGRQAGVGEKLVRIVKGELKLSASETQIGGAKVCRGGTTYTMKPRKKFAEMTEEEQVAAMNEAERFCPTCGQAWPEG